MSAGRGAGARVLVLCADIGEGHVTVARALTEQLRAHDDVEEVALHTDLEVLGRRFGAFMNRGFHVHLEEVGWTYELAYRAFFEPALPRAAAHLALAALGGRGLRRTIAGFRADIVVAEYPVISAALGQLRALGRLPVPVCSSISDPAGLYYWAHRGIDLHLLSWPEAVAEVDRIAGPGRAAPVRPLVDARFFAPPSQAQARSELSLPAERPVIVVSGGGWGIGDLAGAARTSLASVPHAIVVCLTGRNAALHAALSAELGGEPRLRLLGFTDRMPALLAAADALIHTTGGTTALEARLTGCPLINFGTGIAHVRAHARALAELGVAEWAPGLDALGGALRRTLARGRGAPREAAGLPHAADLVIALARQAAGSPSGRNESRSS